MELRDLVVTPIWLIIIYVLAYVIRPYVTDQVNRRYFFPALTIKTIGALAVGFIYQFYYDGGDTFYYHTHGSRHIWDAFADDLAIGIDLLFSDGSHVSGTYQYSTKIEYYNDPQSFFIVRIAAFLDLFTYSSYSATAVLFSVISFIGAWLMFITFYRIAPELHRWEAISCLFIPSVIIWGSGILKDTITLSALGVALYCLFKLAIERKVSLFYLLGLVLSVWIIFSIKKYILLCFAPVMMIWVFTQIFSGIKSLVFKILFVPIAIVPVLFLSYFIVSKIGENDQRYSVTKLARTAQITAYDIRYGWGARTGEGSGYTLGELDGTWQSMARLAPAAIVVSLFRPFLWEIRNPLMALSALESLTFLILTLYVFYKSGSRILFYLQKPEVILCLGFAVVFAFAVGVSTFNFGSLSRYKIPLLPFYAMGLGFIYYYSNKDKNAGALESTE